MVYILGFFIIVFVWKLKKCDKLVENVFSRAFSRTKPNPLKYFPNQFLGCKQLEIFFDKFILKTFYFEPNLVIGRPTTLT